MANYLIYFYKNPEAGKVKTRIAATMGAAKALDLYNYLAIHVRDQTAKTSASKLVYYSKTILQNDIWSPPGFKKKTQSGENLGARMSRAFKECFTEFGTDSRVGILGTDLFPLNGAIIDDAFAMLHEYDIVLGPAMDGGYYFIGMHSYHPELFLEVPWSTDSVFDITLKICRKLNLQVFILPEVRDIDTEEDVKVSGLKSALKAQK